jgi:DNA-binding response OmpR family regulator
MNLHGRFEVMLIGYAGRFASDNSETMLKSARRELSSLVCVCFCEFKNSQVEKADVYVIDAAVGITNALTLIQFVRIEYPKSGVVLLCRGRSSDERIEGYAAGADLCLNWPHQSPEIWACTDSLLRRMQVTAGVNKKIS